MRSRIVLISASAFIFAIALIATGCGSGSAASNVNANNQPAIIDVTTTQAVVKPIPTYFEATGNLVGDEQTDVAPLVAGKVVEVNFDVGSYVQKGSVLIRLDDRDAKIRLETAQAQAEQQKGAVTQAIAALRQAQVRLGVKDGEGFDIASAKLRPPIFCAGRTAGRWLQPGLLSRPPTSPAVAFKLPSATTSTFFRHSDLAWSHRAPIASPME